MADGQVVINTKFNDKPLKDGIKNIEGVTKRSLDSVKKALVATGLTVGVVALVKKVDSLVKGTAQLTDRIDKQSQKIGMSRKAYQEWDYILDQTGANVDGLQMSMKTLSTVVDEAERGNKTYVETLERLGVETKDVNGRTKSQERIFKDVFSALANVSNETERTALASRLLGRSATELAPAMNQGAEAIEDLRNRAYDLGLVLSDTTVDAGVRLTDMMTDLRRATQNAIARAFTPLLEKSGDIHEFIAEKVIPVFERFLTTMVNVGMTGVAVFEYLKEVVKVVAGIIGDALEEPIKKLKGFVTDLLELPAVKHAIDIVLNLAGDLWEGLKKGLKTGDWSDFWQSAIGVAQFAVGIWATLQLATISAQALFSVIQGALIGGGLFKIGPAGYVAMLSVGLAVAQAMSTGDWDTLVGDIIVALTAALVAGGLTKSPTVGALVFTVFLEFKPLSKTMEWAKSLSPETFAQPPIQGAGADEIRQIVLARTGIGSGYGLLNPDKEKLKKIWEIEAGQAILEGLGYGLKDIDKLGTIAASQLMHEFQVTTGIWSPSRKFREFGEFIVAGLEEGLAETGEVATETGEQFIDEFKEVLGIHSNSEEGKQIGLSFVGGIVDGISDALPSLEQAGEKLKNTLSDIWSPEPTAGAEDAGGVPVPSAETESAWSNFFSELSKGWKDFITGADEELEDWSKFVTRNLRNIRDALFQGVADGLQGLFGIVFNQKQILEELNQSISDMQDTLKDSYSDLEDAQEDYNRAVLSGDTKAIRNAERRLRQQEKLVKGHEESLKTLKEEKKSVEDGSKAWREFGKIVIQALAQTLYGLGAELFARAAVALFTAPWLSVGLGVAGGAAIAAGAGLEAWAGSFAEGGIVPQVAGVPSYGDRHLASVNPGELILNQSQQAVLAGQLSGGITVNIDSVYGLDSSEVGQAVYRNIKTLQHEGVLGRW